MADLIQPCHDTSGDQRPAHMVFAVYFSGLYRELVSKLRSGYDFYGSQFSFLYISEHSGVFHCPSLLHRMH